MAAESFVGSVQDRTNQDRKPIPSSETCILIYYRLKEVCIHLRGNIHIGIIKQMQAQAYN